MKTENVKPHPWNVIALADPEWTFITDEDRPALVRIRLDQLTLLLGERHKKSVYDGQFIEAWSCKMDKNARWPAVEAKLKSITITIKD